MPQLTSARPLRALRRRPMADRAPPLLSPGFRVAAILLTAACAAVTALLGAVFAGRTGPGRLDRGVDGRLISGLAGQGGVLSPVADNAPLAVIVLGVLAFCAAAAMRRARVALLVALALPAGFLADTALKPLVHRTLIGLYSYPSGHTIGAFCLAVTVVVVLLGPNRPPLRAVARVLLACVVVLTACTVPVAMIALRMHYFTDTVGGAALATALVLASALLIDAVAARTHPGMLGKGHD